MSPLTASIDVIATESYVAGWLDSSIPQFLKAGPTAFSGSRYALVTCLDSERNLADVLGASPALARLADRITILGRGLLLSTDDLLRLDEQHELFFGFDEVWFFTGTIDVPKPDGVSLVGPRRLSRATLGSLRDWMLRSDCTLGLGDGDGLNFVVWAGGLAGHLLAHSIEQSPDPAPPARDTVASRP